jgi:hypothetical protein
MNDGPFAVLVGMPMTLSSTSVIEAAADFDIVFFLLLDEGGRCAAVAVDL